MAKILQVRPDLVFDDKLSILEGSLRQNIPAVCIAGPHNEALRSATGCERIAGYQNLQVHDLLGNVFGKKLPYLLRAARSDRLWGKIIYTAPLFKMYFRPIVLNPSRRIITKEAVLIFNNSKNPILCHFTAWLFRNLAYFPIERRTDDPDANNFQAIRDMVGFLRIHQTVGIFGEGTTRRPEGADFGTFDDSIITLAKRTGAWVQPVTVYWASIRKKKQIIINFGEAFKVEDTKTAMQQFLQIQQQCLQEDIAYCHRDLSEDLDP